MEEEYIARLKEDTHRFLLKRYLFFGKHCDDAEMKSIILT